MRGDHHFSLVIPFHADTERLACTLRRVKRGGAAWGIHEILLCQNGRGLAFDRNQLPAECSAPIPVRFFRTEEKGIGAGYRLGIENAECPFVILSASDFPFDFSDLARYRELLDRGARPYGVGSKTHPGSKLEDRSVGRRLSTFVFRCWRRTLFPGLSLGDTQGTILAPRELLRASLASVEERGYLFSLELALFARRAGWPIEELPVEFAEVPGTSMVRLWRDGGGMALGCLRLRLRWRT